MCFFSLFSTELTNFRGSRITSFISGGVWRELVYGGDEVPAAARRRRRRKRRRLRRCDAAVRKKKRRSLCGLIIVIPCYNLVYASVDN